jgi:hypothetical protein
MRETYRGRGARCSVEARALRWTGWIDQSWLLQLAPVADRRLGAMADGAGALRGYQAMERCLVAGLPSGVSRTRGPRRSAQVPGTH